MNVARASFTATLLPSGQVLVAGGDDGTGESVLTSAEIYDPATDVWTPVNSMAVGRSGAEAVLLGNGTVLVAGSAGYGSIPSSSAAEIFDPATGTWSNVGSMAFGRGDFTLTVLASGKVLAAGGYNQGDRACECGNLRPHWKSVDYRSESTQRSARPYGHKTPDGCGSRNRWTKFCWPPNCELRIVFLGWLWRANDVPGCAVRVRRRRGRASRLSVNAPSRESGDTEMGEPGGGDAVARTATRVAGSLLRRAGDQHPPRDSGQYEAALIPLFVESYRIHSNPAASTSRSLVH